MAEVIVENVRLSFLNCWEPKPNLSGKLKFGCSCIIPNDNTAALETCQKAIKSTIEQAVAAGKIAAAAAHSVVSPMRNGSEEFLQERKDKYYDGCMFFNANSDNQPGIVDSNVQPIFDQDTVYSGIWANVAVSFYYTNAGGTPRVAVGLNHIMKVKDDNRLDGRSNVQDAFAKYAPADAPSDPAGSTDELA